MAACATITVEREAIERVKLNLGVVLTGVQSVEIRNAVDPQQNRLAIDDERAEIGSLARPHRLADSDRSSRDRCG